MCTWIPWVKLSQHDSIWLRFSQKWLGVSLWVEYLTRTQGIGNWYRAWKWGFLVPALINHRLSTLSLILELGRGLCWVQEINWYMTFLGVEQFTGNVTGWWVSLWAMFFLFHSVCVHSLSLPNDLTWMLSLLCVHVWVYSFIF